MASLPAHMRIDRRAAGIGLFLFAIAGVVLWDPSTQTIAATYGIGPTAMPYVVASVLAIVGFGRFVVAFKDGLPAAERADGVAIVWITIGLAALLVCIGFGGGFAGARPTERTYPRPPLQRGTEAERGPDHRRGCHGPLLLRPDKRPGPLLRSVEPVHPTDPERFFVCYVGTEPASVWFDLTEASPDHHQIFRLIWGWRHHDSGDEPWDLPCW